MKSSRLWIRGVLALAAAAAFTAPAGATTLVRQSLEDLAIDNGTVVVGEVLDAYSYWNAEGTFIFTDVRLQPVDVIKGEAGGEVTVTLLGGTVGDLTTLIVGGAQLVPGRSYVLFLDRDDLPGARGMLTVRDHAQGAFDLVLRGGEVRAVSQAADMPLLPDAFGASQAPGGAEGLSLPSMIQTLRDTVERSQIRKEIR